MEGVQAEEAKATTPLDYYIKKVHSLSGVVPVGAFFVEHIWTNSQAISGPEHFDKAVKALQDLPILIFLEVGFIWLPIAFHALLGIYITLAGRFNIARYPHGANFSYVLQRISGFVILPFLAYHFYEFRLNPEGKVTTFARSAELLASTGIKLAYIVFLLAVCYHFFNGLWNFLCKWGITTGPKAQQRMAMVMTVLGILFFGYSVMTLLAFK